MRAWPQSLPSSILSKMLPMTMMMMMTTTATKSLYRAPCINKDSPNRIQTSVESSAAEPGFRRLPRRSVADASEAATLELLNAPDYAILRAGRRRQGASKLRDPADGNWESQPWKALEALNIGPSGPDRGYI